MSLWRGVLFAALVCLIWGLPAVSKSAELAPHRALYSLSLGRASMASGIVAAHGALFLEWKETCDGWTAKQRTVLRLLKTEGPEIEADTSFASWESKDGLNYQFSVRDLRDGKLFEELRGRADLKGKGQAGKAAFSRPEPLRLALPAGAIFPTEHIQQLIDGAVAGDDRVWRIVFDGATLDGAFEVNAVIGRPIPPEPELDFEPIVNRLSWRMRLAFFPVDSNEPEPRYEMSVRLLDNGVARDMVFDYGDFTINAQLEPIEALSRPDC